jgi:hypothetical protein
MLKSDEATWSDGDHTETDLSDGEKEELEAILHSDPDERLAWSLFKDFKMPVSCLVTLARCWQ